MKIAFEECYETIDKPTKPTKPKKIENQDLWIIVSIIVITVAVIAVITALIYVLLRPMKDKTKTTSQSTKVQSPDIPFSQLGKGSITNDIERSHNRFIDSKTESNVSNKTSNVNQLNTESKVFRH